VTTSITAVFEAGLLRPTTPLDLAEGTRVELIVISDGRNGQQSGHSAASILAEIAALPTSGGDPRTSQDNDKVLYGEQGAR
jgi:predicted DNA-binding antitoxin AbrB/MazE fold protein